MRLLPTPTVSDANGPGGHGDGGMDLRTAIAAHAGRLFGREGRQPEPRETPRGGHSVTIQDVAEHLLPTPTTSNRNGNRVNGRGELLLPGVAEDAASGLLPTPTTDPETGNGHARYLGGEAKRLPTPTAMDAAASGGSSPRSVTLTDATARANLTTWGPYAAAVALWEKLLRPAPAPVRHDGKGGKPRLNPELPEWMMGLEHGHITGVGLTRPEELKAAGNGVVPQQAEAATVELLTRAPEALARLLAT